MTNIQEVKEKVTLQQIRYFIEVADTGNFSHAADRLYTSQPTVTRQIQLLEQEMGCLLFRRNKRPLQMTESGRIFYDGMKKAMQQIDYTREMTRAASEGRYGSLSIGFMMNYFAEYIYIPVINELKDSCPSLKVSCTKGTLPELIRGLQDESLDVVISLDFEQYRDEGLSSTFLKHTLALIVTPAGHRLKAQKVEELKPDDFRGETFYLNAPIESFRVETLLGDKFDLSETTFIETATTEIAYMKVLTENALTISNVYDPFLHGNKNYHGIMMETDMEGANISAVTNPDNQNAVVKLFLELLQNAI